MCGIWAIFGCNYDAVDLYTAALRVSHRGPDNFRICNLSQLRNCVLAFHRLQIVGGSGGMQPMTLKQYPHLTLLCNGEIYNYKQLQEEFGFSYESDSDCEVIVHLYNQFGIKKASQLLDGVFAFLIIDTANNSVLLSRDTFGVRPLFYDVTKNNILGVCSEVKGLCDFKINGHKAFQPQHLPPGHSMVCKISEDGKVSKAAPVQFHRIGKMPAHFLHQANKLNNGYTKEAIYNNLRCLIYEAVEKRLIGQRSLASLLSGGLDSSLISAITVMKMRERGDKKPLQTFTIGMAESPDVTAAREVASYIGSDHSEITFTPTEGMNALETVIYTLETYDPLTIRIAVPLYLLCGYISENTDNVLIMTGEGADELAQGYLYFHKQPTAKDGDIESRYITYHYLFILL
uniref:Asparagine synthetase [glutamine-hydrolyzing] n=2 Tax=Ciona intestinalis TaxID=7719 RepID=F6VKS9_CIOIN